MLKNIMSVAAVMTLASSAYAGIDAPKTGEAGKAAPAPSAQEGRTISYDELRARCENPTGYDQQRAPENIRIQCSDVSREYIPSAAGSVPMPATRTVFTRIISDKGSVSETSRNMEAGSKGGSCLRFKEVEKRISIERPISCSEILNMKSSPEELCAGATLTAKGTSPKLLDVRDTGNVIDTCAGVGGSVPAPVEKPSAPTQTKGKPLPAPAPADKAPAPADKAPAPAEKAPAPIEAPAPAPAPAPVVVEAPAPAQKGAPLQKAAPAPAVKKLF